MSFAKITKKRKAMAVQAVMLKPKFEEIDGVSQVSNITVLPSGTFDLDDMLDRLKDDVLTLRALNTIEEKVAQKNNILLPLYSPLAARGFKEEDPDYDLFVIYCAMWFFDTGKIDLAVELSMYACKHNVETPIEFKSDAFTFLTTEFLKWATPKIRKSESVEPYMSAWFEAAKEWKDLSFIQHANLYKYMGFIAHLKENYEQANEFYLEAIKLNSSVGVKGNLEKAEKAQKLTF